MTIKYLKKGKNDSDKALEDASVSETVKKTLKMIKEGGDKAVRGLSEKFDNYSPKSFKLSLSDINDLIDKVPARDLEDIKFAQEQIRNFAQAQRDSMQDIEIETMPGVILGHKNIPVQSVGCYVPGGKFPMVASAHMSIVTANVAKVPRIIASTPPFHGKPNPAVIAAMHLGGAHDIYILGGIQAVGAMALGTNTISPVDMLVGPGNAFVAEAKRQLFGTVGIDSIAGPSEIVVLADETSSPELVAWDLMAQAEHDEDASSILICTSSEVINEVKEIILNELPNLDRGLIIKSSLKTNGLVIRIENLEQSIKLINRFAPEHLNLAFENKVIDVKDLTAGIILEGSDSAVSLSDYVLGPSHILPTNTSSRFSSPLGVEDFMVSSTKVGIRSQANKALYNKFIDTASIIARAEGLTAHAISAEKRKKN